MQQEMKGMQIGELTNVLNKYLLRESQALGSALVDSVTVQNTKKVSALAEFTFTRAHIKHINIQRCVCYMLNINIQIQKKEE